MQSMKPPAGFSTRAPMKLREAAYESFTERLLSREIAPGQFITQRELVQMTGMPLGAIRELIPRLEADGLVKTIPQRGMQVAHVDLDLIRNAFQFRLFLECAAVARYVETASDEDFARMRADHEAIIAAARQSVDDELRDSAQLLDWAFHDEIIDALGNEIISNAYRVNSVKIRLIRQRETRMLPTLVLSVMKEHLRIIDALETRDPGRAVQALGDHIGNAKNRALER